MEELADAQKKTEVKVAELADEIKVLVKGLDETRGEVGGLSRSVSYTLENEAYRVLPKILKSHYDIELKERLIRDEVGSKEVIRMLIKHYATKSFLKKAKEKGVIVVQSYEW